MNSQNKQDPSLDLLNSLSFCVFDLETTGGNHAFDKIIEVGLVRIENLKITKQKGFLINPEMHIPEFIQKLTDIKDADVEKAPKIDEVIDEILEFMGDSILVAHNTSFDVPFFNSVLRRLKRPEMENKALCTNLMTKYMIPNLLSSNLTYMSNIFDLEHQKAHRALDDARAAAELLLKYLNIFIHKKINKVNSLYYPINKFELDRINYKKDVPLSEIKEQLEKIHSPFMVILKGKEGVVLYSIPLHPNEVEREFILNKIKNTDYEMVTVKLTGPYFQGLIEAASMFSKISAENEKEIIAKLCEYNQISPENISETTSQEMPADFIIFNHLNPEHFVICPLNSLNQKMELVFKYPTHQNKLIQYINSKSARLIQGKVKKDNMRPAINNIICEYIKKNNEYLPLKKQTYKITNADIKEPIEEFIKNHKHNYSFPKEYL